MFLCCEEYDKLSSCAIRNACAYIEVLKQVDLALSPNESVNSLLDGLCMLTMISLSSPLGMSLMGICLIATVSPEVQLSASKQSVKVNV